MYVCIYVYVYVFFFILSYCIVGTSVYKLTVTMCTHHSVNNGGLIDWLNLITMWWGFSQTDESVVIAVLGNKWKWIYDVDGCTLHAVAGTCIGARVVSHHVYTVLVWMDPIVSVLPMSTWSIPMAWLSVRVICPV